MRTSICKIKHEIASPLADADFSSARMREIFLQIKALKKGKKDKEAWQFLKGEIKKLREELKDYVFSVYQMTYIKKNYEFFYLIDDYDKRFSTPRKKDQDVKEYLNERYSGFLQSWECYVQQLKAERAKIREIQEENHECLGFTYKMKGGVFTTNGSVIALQNIENQMNRIAKAKKPNPSQKANYLGIELELITKVTRPRLNEILCQNFLAGYVYVKHDGSIKKENNNEHEHEITVLCKESDIGMVMTRLCNVLNSDEVGSYVNNTCGLHVHLDCRNRDVKKVYNNLVRALPMLRKMVPKSRVESAHAEQYCKMNKTSVFDQAGGDRYTAVNGPDAYHKYKTVEVRMHSGSTNAAKIINWAKILSNLANLDQFLDTEIATSEEYQQKTSCDKKLIQYIVKRTERFTGKMADAMDTRADHYFNEEVEIAI